MIPVFLKLETHYNGVKSSMRKIIFATILGICFVAAKAGVTIPLTEIPYNVNYHWGIIDVNIAHGIVTIESDGNNFHGTLDGVSIPWERHVILVSDTLDFALAPTDGLSKEIVNYQSGWYRRPNANYFRSKQYDPANPANYKNIAGKGDYNASHDSMEAITVTSDMLGMYYYANEIDFPSLKVGEKITIPIEGQYAQEVVVTYLGEGSYEENNETFPTYNLQFEYTYEGSLSGYQVHMRVGKENRLPLFISASLPVGKVEMLYTGEK